MLTTRRRFGLATAAAIPFLGRPWFAEAAMLTARQVIERIQQNVGVPWRAQTSDTFKAGSEETVVTGIADRSAIEWTDATWNPVRGEPWLQVLLRRGVR